MIAEPISQATFADRLVIRDFQSRLPDVTNGESAVALYENLADCCGTFEPRDLEYLRWDREQTEKEQAEITGFGKRAFEATRDLPDAEKEIVCKKLAFMKKQSMYLTHYRRSRFYGDMLELYSQPRP